ncbi:hypothetical protein TrVFT333_004638 [Trichoderma virens FT-333]|nr:hypothetical protein TrVFT333_004638 [Trichoderma virens FT-333]
MALLASRTFGWKFVYRTTDEGDDDTLPLVISDRLGYGSAGQPHLWLEVLVLCWPHSWLKTMQAAARRLVIWHGLGDAYNSEGIMEVGELADEINPGTFTYAIRPSTDPNSDRPANSSLSLTHITLRALLLPIVSVPILVNCASLSTDCADKMQSSRWRPGRETRRRRHDSSWKQRIGIRTDWIYAKREPKARRSGSFKSEEGLMLQSQSAWHCYYSAHDKWL